MVPIEKKKNFDQMVLGTFHFAHSLHASLQRSLSGRTRGLQTERSFSMKQNFRQSLELVGLSQVSKMLQQLTEQFSARYSPKIKKYSFMSFSSGLRTTYCNCFFKTDRNIIKFFPNIQSLRLSAKILALLLLSANFFKLKLKK